MKMTIKSDFGFIANTTQPGLGSISFKRIHIDTEKISDIASTSNNLLISMCNGNKYIVTDEDEINSIMLEFYREPVDEDEFDEQEFLSTKDEDAEKWTEILFSLVTKIEKLEKQLNKQKPTIKRGRQIKEDQKNG